MHKTGIICYSPLDAMIAVAKRLSIYEKNYNMTSEMFYHKYSTGKTDDKLDFVEWANDYDHYMVLKSEIEKKLYEAA